MHIQDIITKIFKEKPYDFFLFNATITDNNVDNFLLLIRNKKVRNETCAVLLTTYGGDPDAGYRMVRTIKRYYNHFKLYVFGSCKSTGTLISLGADEIIMSDFGEFGPLDIQLTKDDELTNTSGLSYIQSLTSLNQHIFNSFERNFLKIKQNSGNTITTRTAAEMASKIAIGLLSPISAQIDPVKLGEVQRAISIADAYGSRLAGSQESLIAKLIADYPSHGFVIDYEEAKQIFPNVRWVDETESELEVELIKIGIVRREKEEPLIADLSDYISEDKEENKDIKEDVEEKEVDTVDEIKEEHQNITTDNNVADNISENATFASNNNEGEQNNEPIEQ